MTGVKGRSGGPRKNAGGARPGSGRKPKPKQETVFIPVEDGMDMLQFLQKVALGHITASNEQVRAAIAAVQYTHTKRSDGGKKEEQQEAAKQAASKFSRQSPPRLVAVDGKPA